MGISEKTVYFAHTTYTDIFEVKRSSVSFLDYFYMDFQVFKALCN